MGSRTRGGSPMDRAADGLQAAWAALTGLYNAVAQGLPMAADAGSRGLVALESLADAAQRGVALAERSAEAYLPGDSEPVCRLCSGSGCLARSGKPLDLAPCPVCVPEG